MRYAGIAACVAALAMGGCAGQAALTPAPGASVLPGPPDAAYATLAGVRLEARAQAWHGRPAALDQELTPILVHVVNGSGRPLMIRYKDFELVSGNGHSYRALPPFRIDRTVTEPIETPLYRPYGFGLAPYLSPYYPGWDAFEGFPPFDEAYFNDYYPTFVNVRLPTPDMLRAALPEGVLQPGGRITGFVYFQHVPDEGEQVRLDERLETPRGLSFGTLSIPFQAR